MGGDLERLDGGIRGVCLTGIGTKTGAGGSGGGGTAVDCVVFDFNGGRYARINCDRCALD